MTKNRFLPAFRVTALACLGVVAVSSALAEIPPQSRRIDELIETDLKRNGITPNDPASDEVFLRRVYLNAIGRIPTLEEAERYYSYDGPSRRGKIIDYLLQTEGYVSHTYNYWADVLRVKSNMNGNTGGAYVAWVKDAIRSNMPYDQFVRELITAEGKIWDNGAVGYYMRDAGMPLDNMSNTTQIFLGTQLVCAQCHNHPFDKWKQKDYYEMAAFTYGVDTRVDAQGELGIQKIVEKEAKKRKGLRITGNMSRALNDILEPLTYGAQDTDRKVQLPHDYQYDDAKPKEEVEANTMFGDDVRVSRRSSPREGYAAWMTGADNPRFTRVIANRLWKRAFGLGLVEPVDDFKDTTKPSNPELLDYLEDTMRYVKYDMRKFMHIIYNTRTFQRAATVEEVPADEPYHFQGPLLQRMSAEQMWDSMMALAIPNPDARSDAEGQRQQAYAARERAEQLRQRDARDILDQAQALAAAMDEFDMVSKRIRDEMLAAQEADDVERVKLLRNELNQAEKTRRMKEDEVNKKYAQGGGSTDSMMGMSMMDRMAVRKKEEQAKNQPKKEDPWKRYGRHLMRASELPSPAPNGHFLREFGQSDRDTIENSHKNAAVSQALMLLNSNVLNDIVGSQSMVAREIGACMTPKEKQDTLFLSVLSRFPTDAEREIVASRVAARGEHGYEDIVVALLNTSRFAFIE